MAAGDDAGGDAGEAEAAGEDAEIRTLPLRCVDGDEAVDEAVDDGVDGLDVGPLRCR